MASNDQFEAADAADIADEAAAAAELIAEDAAVMADDAAAEAVSAAIGADAGAGAGVITGVVVVVVVVSSFLLQAAKDTAAASETISRAVFMVLLGWNDSGAKAPLCWHDRCRARDSREL